MIGVPAAHAQGQPPAPPPAPAPSPAPVDEAEVGPVEQDHPRARAEDRTVEAVQRLVDPVQRRKLHDRRRLPAGDHEAVDLVELLGLPHLDDVRPEGAQHRRVLAEVSLQGEDADPHAASVEAVG